MTHATHELDTALALDIAKRLLDTGAEHKCMNCVLTQWINVGAILLAGIDESVRHRTIARITIELVSKSFEVEALALSTAGVTEQ